MQLNASSFLKSCQFQSILRCEAGCMCIGSFCWYIGRVSVLPVHHPVTNHYRAIDSGLPSAFGRGGRRAPRLAITNSASLSQNETQGGKSTCR